MMRPFRSQSMLLHALRRPQRVLISRLDSQTKSPHSIAPCPIGLSYQIRTRKDTSFPPASRFEPKESRFSRFEDPSEDIDAKLRNPMDYVSRDRLQRRISQNSKKRMIFMGYALLICVILQVYIMLSFGEDQPSEEKQKELRQKKEAKQRGQDRMDATPAEQAALQGKEVIVHVKPGTEELLDEDGNAMVPTGTSTIPHFPKTIQLPSTASASGGAVSSTTDEYTLLGLGVRTVSFLSIQVYVVGLYVRNTDLPALQAAFVRHVNPIASALIPGEKESLKSQLLDGNKSLEVWDKVLRESGINSAVRIVPTRNTDFQHLRDGWVRGITGRTQDAARAGIKEYDDDSFGSAMKEFKDIFGGKGKAPWGSTLLLTRDPNGAMGVLFEEVRKKKEGEKEVLQRAGREALGGVSDERISRQVWLGYLGGKNVSSDVARKSIVNGVMELVERPVGTVGLQVT